MNEKILKVKYFSEDMPKLAYIGGKSDWVDMRTAERYEIKAGEFALLRLGVAIKLPDGYEAHVAPRSSTFKKYGLIQVNSVGIIDTSYCGDNDEWMMPVYATRDTVVEKFERVCQFRIMKNQPSLCFHEVKMLGEQDRHGFGSTGYK